MRIRVSKYNAEGYYSPTEYEGMKNLLREEYERKRAQRKPAFMPKVFICSPLRGDVYKNILNAKKYCRFAVESGYIPFAPNAASVSVWAKYSSMTAGRSGGSAIRSRKECRWNSTVPGTAGSPFGILPSILRRSKTDVHTLQLRLYRQSG